MKKSVIIFALVAFVTIVVNTSTVLGRDRCTMGDRYQAVSNTERWNNEARAQTRQALQELHQTFREFDQRVPDPVDTWTREYTIDVTREVTRTCIDVTKMATSPSAIGAMIGAVGAAATALKPIEPRVFGTVAYTATVTGIARSTMLGDFFRAGFSAAGWTTNNSLLASTFNRNATIAHCAPMNLDRSWRDGWSTGYQRGEIAVVKTFQPDYRSIRANEFPGGTYTTERYLTRPYVSVQTTSINDVAKFERQWNIPSTTINWNTYRPTYTPPVQLYQPPRVQVYTPPPTYRH